MCTLYGCAMRVQRYIPIWMYPFDESSHALAMTSCDFLGNPIILYNQTAYESDEYPEFYWGYIYLHEEQHVRDLLAHPGGCTGGLEQYKNDVNFKMEMELRAECKEFLALLADGRVIQNQFFFRFYDQWSLYGRHMEVADFFKGLDCAREDVWQPQEVANVSS